MKKCIAVMTDYEREVPLPFSPKCKDHAIIEAVFGLGFTRPFTAKEIDLLIAAHGKWRDRLPRLGRTAVFEIGFGEMPPSDIPPAVVPGVAFDRFKPDGNLQWRLRAEANSLMVNCLSYDRWEATWPEAKDYLASAHEILAAPDNLLVGVFLQYINVFEWHGKVEDYKAEELLKADSVYFSSNIMGKGPLWHLHQGWFRYDKLPMEGRMLMRTHIDGVFDNKGLPTVKIDHFLNLQLKTHIEQERIFRGDDAIIDKVFPFLRGELNSLMRSLVTDEIAGSIGLNG